MGEAKTLPIHSDSGNVTDGLSIACLGVMTDCPFVMEGGMSVMGGLRGISHNTQQSF